MKIYMETKNTTMNLENNKRVGVIISSYKWDDKMTDMNCAWFTNYTVYFPLENKIESFDPCSGCGISLEDVCPNTEFVPLNDEYKESYLEKLFNEKIKKCEDDYVKFTKELDEYNEQLIPQKKGQVVKILEGKNKGKIGIITWMGKDSYKKSYNNYSKSLSVRAKMLLSIINYKPYTIPGSEYDLILVRPLEKGTTWEDGKDKVYIDPKKCKVLVNYENVTITKEQVYNWNGFFDDLNRKWNDGYDSRNVITNEMKKEYLMKHPITF